jgi:hypothetical protein
MPDKPPVRNSYNARIDARTTVSQELAKAEHADRCARAGLLPADLLEIVRLGNEARTQDRLQHEDLASQRKDQQDVVRTRDTFEEEQEELRRRLPAVVLDLAAAPATEPLSRWLAAASFDRFRIRTATPPAAAPSTPAPAAPDRERVAREDRLSRAQSATQFLQSLLQPERAPIVEALGRRGMGRERLETLGRTAETLVGRLGDKAVLKRSDATAREAAAVAAQKEKWDACRRMIRAAVQGHADLERLFAAC